MAKDSWHERRKVLMPAIVDRLQEGLHPDDILYLAERGLPRKFIKYNLEDYLRFIKNESWELMSCYVREFWERLNQGKGLMFVGPVGTGKTSAATAMLKYTFAFLKNDEFFQAFADNFPGRLSPEFIVYFWPSAQILMDYFRCKDEFQGKVNSIVLVIDDVTKVSQDIYKEVLDYIVRYRDHSGLPTIITSQCPLKELFDLFGLAIHDILRGNNEEIKLIGESKRG